VLVANLDYLTERMALSIEMADDRRRVIVAAAVV
jgi:hypothetical protein